MADLKEQVADMLRENGLEHKGGNVWGAPAPEEMQADVTVDGEKLIQRLSAPPRLKARPDEHDLYGIPDDLDGPILAPPDVTAIAQKVREKHHRQRLSAAAKIAYVLVPGHKGGGRHWIGRAEAVNGHRRLLCPADFIIRIDWRAWRRLWDHQREALIDHELEHCIVEVDAKGNEKNAIREHDLMEFCAIYERHGAWLRDIEAWESVAKKRQGLLFADAGDEPVVNQHMTRLAKHLREQRKPAGAGAATQPATV